MRIKIFLASSSELEQDRREFEIQINRKNKLWNNRGVFLDLQMWEDFLDAVSRTRSQDEYNRAIKECDIFIMLAGTKIGKYTAEEFETAFAQFKATNKPLIYTYIKDVEISSVHANKDDLKTLWAFQEKLETLEHFWTPYPNADRLKNHFIQQLDKLAEDGRIDLIDEPQMSRGSFGQVTTTGGRLAVNHPGPHVKRDACVNQIKWLEHEIRARPNWLIIEGPTDAGKSVLATQVLDGLSLPSKTVTPSAVFDSGTLGGDFCLLIDPIESGSGLGMDQGNVHLSPLEALLYQIAQKHPQRPVIFCTRESAVADFIEQFALRTRSLERYSERIQCKRDFIDSFTPDEQRRFLDILGIPDRTVHESLLRVVPRLPSSPGMMRVLAQLTVSSLRQILDLADTDPDADLTQKILTDWFPQAFGDEESRRLLASVGAVQCLSVHLEALRGADDWLSDLDDRMFANLLEEQISRGHLKPSYNGKHVSLIRFARLAFANPQLQSLCGYTDSSALRIKYQQRLVAIFDADGPQVAGRSITDRIDAALAIFNAGFLRGSFEQLIAANMRDGHEAPPLANAVTMADRLLSNTANLPRINKTVVELIREAFDPAYDRTCAERMQICRILRKFASDYSAHYASRPDVDDLELHRRLLDLLKTWWSTSWLGHSGLYDAAVAAESLITSATLLSCGQSVSRRSESVASDFTKDVANGIRREAFRGNDHLLIPALVRCMTLLNNEPIEYAWKTPMGRKQWFGDVDQTWIDLATQIRDDALGRIRPRSAVTETIGDMRRSDFQRSPPSYLGNEALIHLICARGDTTSLLNVDSKALFNPNLLFWLGDTFEHSLMRDCAVELRRSGIPFEGTHTVMISARKAAQHIRWLSEAPPSLKD